MSVLRARAPAKLNLCLLLGPPRPDGLHELVSLVESLSLADELELSPLDAAAERDEVVCPGVEGPNLAAAALAAFRQATGWDGPPSRLTVAKQIPVAAGLGGGSTDAAAALRLAVAAADHVGAGVLEKIAPQLGADVPAQLVPGTHVVAGAGEEVLPADPLPRHGVLLLPSPERLSTRAVYAEADRLELPRSARDLAAHRAALEIALRRGGFVDAHLLVNDLEPAARSLCPSIGGALSDARAAGADRALVCGSGPTVAGLFPGPAGPEQAAAAAADMGGRHPGAVAAEPVDAEFARPLPAETDAA